MEKEKKILTAIRDIRKLLEQQQKALSLILYSLQQQNEPEEEGRVEVGNKEDKLTDKKTIEPFRSYVG